VGHGKCTKTYLSQTKQNPNRAARPNWGKHKPVNTLNQETLLFEPAQPQLGALKTVLAFPSTYSVGITSLGYQVVWATLAKRPDLDVRRLFTDQGDPPLGP